jgi:hypothetical protein
LTGGAFLWPAACYVSCYVYWALAVARWRISFLHPPLGWPAPVQGLGKGRYAPKSNGYPFKHSAFRAPLAYLHAGRAYFIAITIEGSNIVSARIGKREKPGWKAGFLIANAIFRSLTQYFETTGGGVYQSNL